MNVSIKSAARILAAAAGSTVLAMLVYATVQQTYRQGANDPQIQLAEDAAAMLRAGASPSAVVPPGSVDIASSLAPYVVVYDRANRVLASSGHLDGEPPVPPLGVIALARRFGGNSVTWQPKPSVRSAIVLQRVSDQDRRVVLAGRSLREVETREFRLVQMVGIAWIALLILSVGFAALLG